jgi:hypothetical protein
MRRGAEEVVVLTKKDACWCEGTVCLCYEEVTFGARDYTIVGGSLSCRENYEEDSITIPLR